jgi:hypothetical protein
MSATRTSNGHVRPTPPTAFSPACHRLEENRALLADWLEQDRVAQAHPSPGRWVTGVVLPMIDGLRQHPTASLALGALAQAWIRQLPAGGSHPPESQPLGTVITVVRQHPKTTLALTALVGAAWWWSRSRPHPSSPT